MKIAYLIQCHKNAKQINLLIDNLTTDECDFYIHIDKKSSSIESQIRRKDNIFIIEQEKSIDVKWGQSSQVVATLALINKVCSSNKGYDYVWLISGQDFPIKSQDYIHKFLKEHRGSNFIEIIDEGSRDYKRYLKRNAIYYPKWIVNNKIIIKIVKKLYILLTGGNYHTWIFKRKNSTNLKFHFGSQWWTLTYETVSYINEYVKKHKEVLDFYGNTVCADESFFQTIFMNSPYKEKRENYLTLVDWSDNNRSPKTFTIEDYNRLINSQYLMARKFDMDVDKKIITKLIDYLKKD